ncbi:cobalamin biosynthesis protein [Jatrophihabitans sp. DSM 45814]
MKSGHARSLGLLVGMGLDAIFGDPSRGHPVAAFGTAASALETRIWADTRKRGLIFSSACICATTAVGIAIERGVRHRPAAETFAVALATWAVLGGTSLRREAAYIDGHLRKNDLPAARTRLTHLVGRDPSDLDAGEIARATVESVAENTSDAVVAPLFWGAIAGVPGLLGYRAVNTLDAMVGHHSQRYENFGWTAARLDDLANLAPARFSAALTALAAPLVGGSPRDVVQITRRDGRKHPSPNAGWCEAAFAGALGVTLGGTNSYGGRIESRPLLGSSTSARPVRSSDLTRANLLNLAVCAAAGVAASVLALGLAVGSGLRRKQVRR